MKIHSFPSSVGSFWRYEEVGYKGAVDTVSVRVAAKVDSSAIGPAKVWVFESSGGIDTLFMTVTSDTVRFFRRLEPDPWTIKFVFPIRVGDFWWGDHRSDSSRVPAKELVTVPAGVLGPAYRIEEVWGIYNEYGRVKTRRLH